jgi:CDP-diacylglycerol--glycerol-3-phosphate 3-phosphatidyltransferase
MTWVVAIDLMCAVGVLALGPLIPGLYAWHRWRVRSEQYERVESEQGSAILSKEVMTAGYWLVEPLARAAVRAGYGPDLFTWCCFALAAASGLALSFGLFGVAALCATVSSFADGLDGIAARLAGTSSDAGAVLDSAVDRYAEFFVLGGAIVYFRHTAGVMIIVLAALLASFMVSYGTAKAEALRVAPPRGMMRRSERAVYLTIGAALVPLVAFALHRSGRRTDYCVVPYVVAVSLVAVVGNVSAVRRLRALRRRLREAV